MNNPLSAADSLAVVLVLMGILLIFDGYRRQDTVYMVIGTLEFVLAAAQMYHNRQ